MIEKFLEWYKLLEDNREKRNWVYAYVIVPGAVLSYMISGLSPVSPFSLFEDGLSVIPIKSVDDGSGKVASQEGAIFILDTSELDLSVPWPETATNLGQLLVSIDRDLYKGNVSRLALDRRGLRARLPLLGVSEPVALVTLGAPVQDVLLPGRRVPVSSLALTARSSVSFALWGIMASMFGIGLSIGMSNGPFLKPDKDSGRNGSAQKNERKVIQRNRKKA